MFLNATRKIPNLELGSVINANSANKEKGIKEERKRLLNSIGFVWDVNAHDVNNAR